MKKIIVVCEAGITTSLLVKKLKEIYLEKEQDVEIDSKTLEEGLEFVEENSIDTVLLGPQVHHMDSKYEELTDAEVIKISVSDYNNMNVHSIYEKVNKE